MEGASSGSAILKLYNRWHEKLVSEETRVNTSSKEKKGFISKVKATIQSKDKKVCMAGSCMYVSGRVLYVSGRVLLWHSVYLLFMLTFWE